MAQKTVKRRREQADSQLASESMLYSELAHPPRNECIARSIYTAVTGRTAGLIDFDPRSGFTNWLCQCMHFSEKPAGTPRIGARGGEYEIQKNYFIKQKQQALEERGHAFLFQCRGCLTASSLLEMTTEASTIQMRAGW